MRKDEAPPLRAAAVHRPFRAATLNFFAELARLRRTFLVSDSSHIRFFPIQPRSARRGSRTRIDLAGMQRHRDQRRRSRGSCTLGPAVQRFLASNPNRRERAPACRFARIPQATGRADSFMVGLGAGRPAGSPLETAMSTVHNFTATTLEGREKSRF